MSADVNVVVISGRLVKDPEVKEIGENKTNLAKFAIASDGRKEEVSFFDVNVWGPRAVRAGEILKKGSYVVINGRLRQEKWETDGQKRSTVTINTDGFEFMPLSKKQEEKPEEGGTFDE